MTRLLALTVTLLLAACSRYPSNDFECRVKASESPTAVGARELIDACEVRFLDEIRARPK